MNATIAHRLAGRARRLLCVLAVTLAACDAAKLALGATRWTSRSPTAGPPGFARDTDSRTYLALNSATTSTNGDRATLI